jgi:hypothetical protein
MTRTLITILVSMALLACSHATPILDRFVSYQVKSDVQPVGDVEGHFAGSFRNHGACLRHVGLPDEEVGVQTTSGTFDGVFTSASTMSKCAQSGKSTCTFADGSSITDEWTATCKHGPKGRLVSEGRSTFVEGTGRFEGIQGGGTFTGKELLRDPENLWVSTPLTGTVTLPKK